MYDTKTGNKTEIRDRKQIIPKYRRGSFTVEASLLFPVLILLIIFFLHTAISCYEHVWHITEAIQSEQELDTTAIFFRTVYWKELKQSITDGGNDLQNEDRISENGEQ